jgi:hypothetical protein
MTFVPGSVGLLALALRLFLRRVLFGGSGPVSAAAATGFKVIFLIVGSAVSKADMSN